MNQKQFDVLVYLNQSDSDKLSRRKSANDLKISLGIVNKTLIELEQNSYINEHYVVSTLGISALEPYRVKKAVFLAAGLGERLLPATLKMPKALIPVHGVRIITTFLDALITLGIDDITIVRGHLKEQFDDLLKDYPTIKFIDNELYNETKNISSAWLARDLFADAYIIESDLILLNPNLLSKYEYRSAYYGKQADISQDWCFEVKSGFITKVKVGGIDVYEMAGISYWNERDAQNLKKDIDTVYHQPGGLEKYWDDVPLKVFKDHYKVALNECTDSDIIELNTYRQLKSLDEIYNT